MHNGSYGLNIRILSFASQSAGSSSTETLLVALILFGHPATKSFTCFTKSIREKIKDFPFRWWVNLLRNVETAASCWATNVVSNSYLLVTDDTLLPTEVIYLRIKWLLVIDSEWHGTENIISRIAPIGQDECSGFDDKKTKDSHVNS